MKTNLKMLVSVWSILVLFAATSELPAKGISNKEAESAFSELKIYDDAGHPWRIVKEDWGNARKLAADDPAWKEWVEIQRKPVDAWMAKFPCDRIEWISHKLSRWVSPKDSSSLIWTDKIPGEEVDHLYSATDPNVPITPTLMGAWIFQFRCKHIRMLPEAARLYRLTGDEKYAAWAARQIQYYADNYEKWPLSTHWDDTFKSSDGVRLFYTGLDEAVQSYYTAEAARVLDDYVTPETRKYWNDKFFRPEAIALENHFLNKTICNVAMWQEGAVASLGLMLGDENLWKAGLAGIRYQLEGVTNDYIWQEQTFGYNTYVVAALQKLFYVADLYGKGEELSLEKNIAANMILSPLYLRCPDGTLPATADTTRTSLHAPDPGLMMSIYRFFPTVIGLKEAAKIRSWDTLLDPPPAPPENVRSLPEIKSCDLKSMHMAQMKSGPWQIFFHYGQLTWIHAQDEVLNYSVFYNDIDITHNCGTWKYGTPLHQQYFTQAPSHNIPLINGLGQQTRPMTGEMTKFSTEPPVMSAVFPNFQPDTTAWRSLEIKDGNLVDTVKIETKSPDAVLGLPIHLQGKIQLPSDFQPYSDESFIKAHPDPFKYWKNIQRAEYTDRAEFRVEYKGLWMNMTIAASGKFTVWYAVTPDMPILTERETLYVEVSGQKSATFTTTFSPDVQ